MKKSISIAIGLVSFFYAYSQDFAPIGTEWYFEEDLSYYTNSRDYIYVYSNKDTVVNGVNCREIRSDKVIGCLEVEKSNYIYSSGDTVYFYNELVEAFEILYTFGAEVGDSWEQSYSYYSPDSIHLRTVTVDSISVTLINGNSLRTLHVTYIAEFFGYSSIIINEIGDIDYLFNLKTPWELACDDSRSGGLRCFENDRIGYYSTGLAGSCDLVTSTAEGNRFIEKIQLYPNPATDHLNVFVSLQEVPKHTYLRLTNLLGQVVATQEIEYKEGTYIFPVFDFPQGQYVLSLASDGEVLRAEGVVLNRFYVTNQAKASIFFS